MDILYLFDFESNRLRLLAVPARNASDTLLLSNRVRGGVQEDAGGQPGPGSLPHSQWGLPAMACQVR